MDILIFPGCRLGELVEADLLRPWPPALAPGAEATVTEVAEYRWDDLLPLLRREELRWDQKIYGVSFGSPQLVLQYRRDLFDQWGLEVPTTWTQYQALLPQLQQRITDDIEAKEAAMYATVEPLEAGWAARSLLARSAAYARYRSQYSTLFHFGSMEPLINRPPFVRALQQLVEAIPFQPPDALQLSPKGTTRLLREGKAAMAIGWPSAAQLPYEPGTETPAVAFAELPGSTEVYHLKDEQWRTRGKPTTLRAHVGSGWTNRAPSHVRATAFRRPAICYSG